MGARMEVVAAVIWHGERFLAVQRPPGKVMAGYWEFPGGKLEPGESPEAALVRELEEELGIVARDFVRWREKCHTYDHAVVRLFFFQIHAFDGVPTAREGQRLAWVRPGAEAAVLEFLPADCDIVAALAAPDQA